MFRDIYFLLTHQQRKMGNEHSGGRFGGNGTNKEKGDDDGGQTSPSTSTGIPASFSFLAKKRMLIRY